MPHANSVCFSHFKLLNFNSLGSCMFSPNITTKISTKNMMGGTSQDQSHNVITIEHAIVSRIFMACKEHSWRNVLVGGFETGSRPSRKCKSMQILWVKNICFFFHHVCSRIGPRSSKTQETYYIQCPFLLLQCSFKILQDTMWAICFWQIILGLLPLLWMQLSALRWCYGRKCACAISVVEWQRRIPDFKIQDSIFQVV